MKKWIGIPLVIFLAACSPEKKSTRATQDSFGRFWDAQLEIPTSGEGRRGPRSFITAQTLSCMWRAGDPGASRATQQFRSRISPYLVDAFNRTIQHNQISSSEAIHFFTQLFHETGGFMLLAELAPDRYFGSGDLSWRERINSIPSGGNLCANYQRAFSSDRAEDFFNTEHIELYGRCTPNRSGGADYGVRRQTISRHTYGYRWRGRGLTQLTHCSNYIRYSYYLSTGRELTAEKRSGRPITHTFSYEDDRQTRRFTFTTGGGEHPLNISNCSEGLIDGLIAHMRSQGVRNFDSQGILTNPDRMSNYCEPYFADSAGWYWRLHVQGLFPLRNRLTSSQDCNCSGVSTATGPVFTAIPSRPRSTDVEGRCVPSERSEDEPDINHGCFQNDRSVRGSDRTVLTHVVQVTKAINGAYCHQLRRRYELYQAFENCFQ